MKSHKRSGVQASRGFSEWGPSGAGGSRLFSCVAGSVFVPDGVFATDASRINSLASVTSLPIKRADYQALTLQGCTDGWAGRWRGEKTAREGERADGWVGDG